MKFFHTILLTLLVALSYAQNSNGGVPSFQFKKNTGNWNAVLYQQKGINREDSTQSARQQEKHPIPGIVVDGEKGVKERKTDGFKHSKSVRKEER